MNLAEFTYYVSMNGHFQTSDDQETILPDLEPLYEAKPVVFSFNTPAWYVLFTLLFIALIFGFGSGINRIKVRNIVEELLKDLRESN